MEKVNLCNCKVINYENPVKKYYFAILIPVGLHDVTTVSAKKLEELGLKISSVQMLPEGDLYIFETTNLTHDERYIRENIDFVILKECIVVLVDIHDKLTEEVMQKLYSVCKNMKEFDEIEFDTFMMNLNGNCNRQSSYHFSYSERANVEDIVRILNDAGIDTTMKLRSL